MTLERHQVLLYWRVSHLGRGTLLVDCEVNMDDSMDWRTDYAEMRGVEDADSEGSSMTECWNNNRCGYDAPVSIAYVTEQRDGPFSEEVSEMTDGSLSEGEVREVREWLEVCVLVVFLSVCHRMRYVLRNSSIVAVA